MTISSSIRSVITSTVLLLLSLGALPTAQAQNLCRNDQEAPLPGFASEVE